MGIEACDVCKNGSDAFILCINCYHSGGTCNYPSAHSLYAFLVARLPETGNVSSYEKEYGNGLITCNTCEKQISQGAYYRKFSVVTPPLVVPWNANTSH